MKRTGVITSVAGLLAAVSVLLSVSAGPAVADTADTPIITKAGNALRTDHVWVDPAIGSDRKSTITTTGTNNQKQQLEDMIANGPHKDVFVAVVPKNVINEVDGQDPNNVEPAIRTAAAMPGVYAVWFGNGLAGGVTPNTSSMPNAAALVKSSHIAGDPFASLKNFVTQVEKAPVTKPGATAGNSTTTTTTTVIRKQDHTLAYVLLIGLGVLLLVGLGTFGVIAVNKKRRQNKAKQEAFEAKQRTLNNRYNGLANPAYDSFSAGSGSSVAYNLYMQIDEALKNAKTIGELNGIEKDLDRLDGMLNPLSSADHPDAIANSASAAGSAGTPAASTSAPHHAEGTTDSSEHRGRTLQPSTIPAAPRWRPANPSMYPAGYGEYDLPGYGIVSGYPGPGGMFYELAVADLILHGGMYVPPFGYYGPDAYYGYNDFDGYNRDWNYQPGYSDANDYGRSDAGDGNDGIDETITTTTVTTGSGSPSDQYVGDITPNGADAYSGDDGYTQTDPPVTSNDAYVGDDAISGGYTEPADTSYTDTGYTDAGSGDSYSD